MPAFRLIALLVLVAAAAYAAEEDRSKKDAAGMTMVVPMEDDGSYYPGKYDKPLVHHPLMPYAAMYHPMPYHPIPAAYPYAYTHMPVAKAMFY